MKKFKWHEVNDLKDLKIFYDQILPKIQTAAKRHGYAIGVHGSMQRDLDLIAVPWKDKHSAPGQLARAVHYSACGLRQKAINGKANHVAG